ncbi:hypothetical protein KC325_g75 [Hortaea werneckii]|nr:hypothetical protein KC325_g75 [Hortaea werneckii]
MPALCENVGWPASEGVGRFSVCGQSSLCWRTASYLSSILCNVRFASRFVSSKRCDVCIVACLLDNGSLVLAALYRSVHHSFRIVSREMVSSLSHSTPDPADLGSKAVRYFGAKLNPSRACAVKQNGNMFSFKS